jgi:hypothetical protein
MNRNPYLMVRRRRSLADEIWEIVKGVIVLLLMATCVIVFLALFGSAPDMAQ